MKGNTISLKDLIAKYGPRVKLKKVKNLPEATGTTILDSVSIDEPDGVFIVSLDVEKSTELGLQRQRIKKGRYTGIQNTYQDVVEKVVADGTTFYLQEIAIVSDKPGTALWEISIDGEIEVVDGYFLQAYSVPVKGLEDQKGMKITAGKKILVRVKTDDGVTSINADAVISGVEVQ